MDSPVVNRHFFQNNEAEVKDQYTGHNLSAKTIVLLGGKFNTGQENLD